MQRDRKPCEKLTMKVETIRNRRGGYTYLFVHVHFLYTNLHTYMTVDSHDMSLRNPSSFCCCARPAASQSGRRRPGACASAPTHSTDATTLQACTTTVLRALGSATPTAALRDRRRRRAGRALSTPQPTRHSRPLRTREKPAGATPHLAKSPATVARTEAPVVALHSTRRRVTPSMVVVVVVVPRRRDGVPPTPHPPLSSGLYRSAHGVRPARCAAGRAGGGAGGVSRGGGRSGDGQWAGHRVGIGDGVGTRDGH